MIKKYCIYIIFQFLVLLTFGQNTVDRIPFEVSPIDPGYSYGLNSRDIINGVNYSYIQNDSITLNFSPSAVLNNEFGSRHKGSIMDFILKSTNRDNIDWTMFMLSNNSVFDFADNTKVMGVDSAKINPNDSSFNVYGYAKYNTQIKITIKYKLLPNSPIVKIKVIVKNKNQSTVNGYLGYFVDPEEPTQENTYIPGKGTNAGIVNNGWTGKYIYSGLTGFQKSPYQNHALAWVKNDPSQLIAYSYSFGISYNYTLKSQDSMQIEFYQVSAVANKLYSGDARTSVTNWVDNIYNYDSELSASFQVIAGKVEGVNNAAVKDVTIKLLANFNAKVEETRTNEFGDYKLIVPKLLLNKFYSITTDKIGYIKQTKKFQPKSQKQINIDFNNKNKCALKETFVDASFTKKVDCNGLVGSTEGDLILENDYLVMGISNKYTLPNSLSKKGTILDFYVKGQDLDLLEWLKISKISTTFDTLDAWWKNDNLWIDTVYILEKTSTRVVVRTEGRLTRSDKFGPLKMNEVNLDLLDTSIIICNNIKVINDYILEKDNNYVLVNTILDNLSTDTVSIYFGDVLKVGGGNEKSYIPGVGEINSDFGQSSEYLQKPIQPWFATYGKYNVSYGIIYNDIPTNTYAVRRWSSSVNKYKIAPSASINVSRLIGLAENRTNNLFRQSGIYNIYKAQAKRKSNFVANVYFSKREMVKGDTLKVTLKYFNYTQLDIVLYSKVDHPAMFRPVTIQNNNVVIPKGDSLIINLFYIAITGGKSNFVFNYKETNKYLFQENYSVFVNGPGWFRGDNHTHSIYSDGSNTIEENVKYARDLGLAFFTATDHNTIAHFSEIARLSNIYRDIILMAGEEITTSRGHCLAYNINTLVPWNLNNFTEQNLVDSVNRQLNNFGNGFVYIAHPNDIIYKWRTWNLLHLRGIEVWNSYNLDFNFKDKESNRSFVQWDSLNLAGHRLFGIANSDAHSAINVGANYIVAKLDTFSKEEVIKVLGRKGSFYGSNGPQLDFSINSIEMGGTVEIQDEYQQVICRISANSNSTDPIRVVRLIRNGQIVETWYPNALTFFVKQFIPSYTNDFYRIEVDCGGGYAFSNPIWISQNNISQTQKINANSNSNSTDQPSEFEKSILTVNPNPASSEIEVLGLIPNTMYHYHIKSLQGKTVSSGELSASENRIELSGVMSDMYILNIFPEVEISCVKRLLIVVKKD